MLELSNSVRSILIDHQVRFAASTGTQLSSAGLVDLHNHLLDAFPFQLLSMREGTMGAHSAGVFTGCPFIRCGEARRHTALGYGEQPYFGMVTSYEGLQGTLISYKMVLSPAKAVKTWLERGFPEKRLRDVIKTRVK